MVALCEGDDGDLSADVGPSMPINTEDHHQSLSKCGTSLDEQFPSRVILGLNQLCVLCFSNILKREQKNILTSKLQGYSGTQASTEEDGESFLPDRRV